MFKKKYRALSWKGTSHAPKHAGSQKTGKALWQKRIWVSWWTLSWAWAIKAPFQQGRPAASWAALGRASAAGWGRWFSPSSQHWWATWGVHGLVQGSPRWTDMDELERVQQRATKTNGMEHLMYKPSQLHLLSLEKRGIRRDLIYTSREGAKKVGNRLLSVVPKGWEAMATKWNTNSI